MDKNKSIDGLTTRRAKISATRPSPSRKTATKTTTKPATKKPTARTNTKKPSAARTTTARTTTRKTTARTTVKKPATRKPSIKRPITVQSAIEQPPTIAPKPTPQSSAEDFLQPIQAFDFDEQTGELKAADPSETTNKSKKAKKMHKKPVSKKRKIITGILLFIVLILLGGVIWFILWGNDIIAKITGGQGNIFDLFTENYVDLKTDENGRTNILAFGTSGYNMDGDEGNGTHDGAQLTDSIMVISLDQKTGDVAMLSLPRDLKASSTCTATGKINEIYWCNNMDGNNEQSGAEALSNEVGKILDLDFQYYAHLNWGSLIQIVNTLGGIEVTLDEDISDYGWTGAVFKAGETYTIDGDQALGLARARHGTASGDFTRGASQQKILIGIKDKVLEKQLSLTDIISLASTLGDNLRTNFSIDEMKSLAHLTYDFDFNNIRQVSLIEPERLMTTGTINGISYVLPVGGNGNYSNIRAYVAKMFSSDPKQYEDPTILILNANDTPGAAANEKIKLEEDNYPTIYVDDAPATGEFENEYTLYARTEEKPGTKKLLEEKYNTTAKTLEELPAGIDTTCDFVIIVNKKSE